jgi:hypothetical protein
VMHSGAPSPAQYDGASACPAGILVLRPLSCVHRPGSSVSLTERGEIVQSQDCVLNNNSHRCRWHFKKQPGRLGQMTTSIISVGEPIGRGQRAGALRPVGRRWVGELMQTLASSCVHGRPGSTIVDPHWICLPLHWDSSDRGYTTAVILRLHALAPLPSSSHRAGTTRSSDDD